MRKTLAFGMMAALAMGGAAWADHGAGYDPALDEVLFVGTVGPISDGQSMSFDFLLDNPNQVIGFSFAGDYVVQDPGGWGSDTHMRITGPSGSTVGIGGFGSPSDLDWDFQGPDSAPLGFYSSGPHFHGAKGAPVFNSNGDGSTNKPGNWSIVFTQDFGAAGTIWENVEITLHKIPAPGAMALLGVAGLMGGRRRRRI